jgi:hypothetical protein
MGMIDSYDSEAFEPIGEQLVARMPALKTSPMFQTK